jgi:hypothetical protein
MQLHPVDTEASPPYPGRPRETRALRNLSRGCKTESTASSRRATFLGRRPSRRGPRGAEAPFKAPELPHPPMERGRIESNYPGEQVREKPLSASRKKERSLSTPRSCWKSARVMTSESASCLRDSADTKHTARRRSIRCVNGPTSVLPFLLCTRARVRATL